MKKPTKWPVHPAKTQISLSICPVWSESLLCTQLVAKDPMFLYADREDWSYWGDAQIDMSLRWAYVILLVLSCCISTCLLHHLQVKHTALLWKENKPQQNKTYTQSHVHQAKTQISLPTCAVWSGFLHTIWVAKYPMLLHSIRENS